LLDVASQWFDNFDELQKVVHEKGVSVLYWVGDWSRQRIKWALKKPPPKRLTKKGRISAVWKREQSKTGKPRAPYRRTGLLHDKVAFEVDKKELSVRAGPQFVPKVAGDVHPTGGKTILQLLEEGGTATTEEAELTPWYRNGIKTHEYWKPTGSRTQATYRKFPFIAPNQEKAQDKFLDRLKKKGLT
jgi:hypothetical protein